MRPQLARAMKATYGHPSHARERVATGSRHDDLLRAEATTRKEYEALLRDRDEYLRAGLPLPPKQASEIGEAREWYDLASQTLAEFERRNRLTRRS